MCVVLCQASLYKLYELTAIASAAVGEPEPQLVELLAALAGEVAPGSSEHLFWAQQYRCGGSKLLRWVGREGAQHASGHVAGTLPNLQCRLKFLVQAFRGGGSGCQPEGLPTSSGCWQAYHAPGSSEHIFWAPDCDSTGVDG